jgi:hypothetical protein
VGKVALRQPQLAKRYSTTLRTILRMRQDRRIPPPDFYLGQYPLWWEETLEQAERTALCAPPKTTTNKTDAA